MLTQEAGTPLINFTVMSPAGTLYAADYPGANWYFTDPAQSALFGHHYYIMTPDSLVTLGEHTTGSPYEIYDDPQLDMAFPMAYNQTVVNSYSKTSYNAGGGVTSSQTGTITLTYEGNGTLVLPSATYTDVAKLKSVRTNSIGPTTTSYLWVKATTGERLLMYNGNGSTQGVHKAGAPASVSDLEDQLQVGCGTDGFGHWYISSPSPIRQLELLSLSGQTIFRESQNGPTMLHTNLPVPAAGVYLLRVKTDAGTSVKKVSL